MINTTPHCAFTDFLAHAIEQREFSTRLLKPALEPSALAFAGIARPAGIIIGGLNILRCFY